jgi:hypothetical protein
VSNNTRERMKKVKLSKRRGLKLKRDGRVFIALLNNWKFYGKGKA